MKKIIQLSLFTFTLFASLNATFGYRFEVSPFEDIQYFKNAYEACLETTQTNVIFYLKMVDDMRGAYTHILKKKGKFSNKRQLMVNELKKYEKEMIEHICAWIVRRFDHYNIGDQELLILSLKHLNISTQMKIKNCLGKMGFPLIA